MLRAVVAPVSVALALVAAPAASAACAGEDLRPTVENLDQVSAAVLCLHNEERRAAGISRVRPNALLAAAADAHSADMVSRAYFAHDTPTGTDPFERMARAGYIRKGRVWNAGENIGWGTGPLSTPRSMVTAWMKSYSHRLTLLASDLAEVGVGIALGAPSTEHAARADAVTYTVDFGWRESARRPKRARPLSGRNCRPARSSARPRAARRC